MASLNSNNVFLSLNGVDISAYFTDEVDREVSINQVDVTAGAGQEWEQYLPGLSSYSLTLTLIYDTVAYAATVRPVIDAARLATSGPVPLIYGPESNTAGKPKDEIPVVVESISGPSISIQKDKVVIELSLKGADTPTALIESGGVFS